MNVYFCEVKILKMKRLLEILWIIEQSGECVVHKYPQPISLPFDFALPEDLTYYLQHYAGIELFREELYAIKIVGISEFRRANPVIIGEEAAYDRSYHWFIIADDNNSQYITIDTDKDRLGYCYDSFWDVYGIAGSQGIIAKSFTELLERLYHSKGMEWYWTGRKFSSYGDAYDE